MLWNIHRGQFDEHLDEIRETISARIDKRSEDKFAQMGPGTLVRFNKRANPKYLRGHLAVVEEKKKTRVVIKLGQSIGRFDKGSPITTPVGILEVVDPTSIVSREIEEGDSDE